MRKRSKCSPLAYGCEIEEGLGDSMSVTSLKSWSLWGVYRWCKKLKPRAERSLVLMHPITQPPMKFLPSFLLISAFSHPLIHSFFTYTGALYPPPPPPGVPLTCQRRASKCPKNVFGKNSNFELIKLVETSDILGGGGSAKANNRHNLLGKPCFSPLITSSFWLPLTYMGTLGPPGKGVWSWSPVGCRVQKL